MKTNLFNTKPANIGTDIGDVFGVMTWAFSAVLFLLMLISFLGSLLFVHRRELLLPYLMTELVNVEWLREVIGTVI